MARTADDHRAMVKDLKRRKIGDRQYEIVQRSTDKVIAIATQTGEFSRDNYPWDAYGVEGGGIPHIPAQDSLTHCIEAVASRLLDQKEKS